MLFDVASYLEVKFLMPVIRLVQILIVALSSSRPDMEKNAEQTLISEEFDFVVVGAGTAGCVLANRLTEVANWTVLLIEAGGDPPSISKSPLLSIFSLESMPDWGYYSENDGYSSQARKTKTVHHIMGKMLGGSSSLNYMYHVRGNKADYDEWAELGNPGWEWKNVEEYFKKSEKVEKELRSESRGDEGLTGVTRQSWEHRTGVYLKGFAENGRAIVEDYNSNQRLGYSAAQFAIANGVRQSSEEAYLKPKEKCLNLKLLKATKARKVIFDSNKNAVGVEVSLRSGKVATIKAKKEVILSSGAVNSPQLLMLSGIGPKEHLTDMGVNVIHDSPSVGENLQDHAMIHLMVTGNSGITSIVKNVDIVLSIGNFPVPTLIGFSAANRTQTRPDYQTTVCPLPAAHLMVPLTCSQIFNLEDDTCQRFVAAGNKRETLHALLTLLHPESRGHIRLNSSDPDDKALLYNGYFSNDRDLENFARNVADYLSVLKTRTFRSFKSEVVNIGVEECDKLGLKFGSHEYWKCYIRNTAASHYHLVGTCAMGPEGKGVTDERLKVRGVKRLRMVGACVMPRITSGNTNAPVLMIAEKAADMIKEDNGVSTDENARTKCPAVGFNRLVGKAVG